MVDREPEFSVCGLSGGVSADRLGTWIALACSISGASPILWGRRLETSFPLETVSSHPQVIQTVIEALRLRRIT